MQIALSTVLLVGAGLLTRAISHAMSLDPGFPIAEIQEVFARGAAERGRRRCPDPRDADDAGLPPMAFSSFPPITSARMEIGVRHPNQARQRIAAGAATGFCQLFRRARHSVCSPAVRLATARTVAICRQPIRPRACSGQRRSIGKRLLSGSTRQPP